MERDDEEPTRWTSIGWQALLIRNRLRTQAQLADTNEKQDGENTDGANRRERTEQHEAYVAERLRKIEAFERRAAGVNTVRRKRRE